MAILLIFYFQLTSFAFIGFSISISNNKIIILSLHILNALLFYLLANVDVKVNPDADVINVLGQDFLYNYLVYYPISSTFCILLFSAGLRLWLKTWKAAW